MYTQKVLLLLRVLILKMSPRYLTPAWPQILAELICVLSNTRNATVTAIGEKTTLGNLRLGNEVESTLVLAALKLVDMAGLLDLEVLVCCR